MPTDILTSPPARDLPIHGVPRAVLERHARARIAPALRHALLRIELEEAGPVPHLGLMVDVVAWRAVWTRPGLPPAQGSFGVWNGEPI